ncbi:Peptidoglycan-binding (PGRP) domain of peptidoglycan hydrolases-containing protein [Ornithinimicrobium cerasi]|uniref:Peptidoglycan-binding (PGRP) domain of peptidoglycan hydrolases-containing protein n=2 Tax=Ornithinimicrobium cerasi TaxID=2248773 RepID=A0A285VTX0_9MICO|nr:Peptidoglycan-binding (PGRP) domain of peptidoglycan hydrolases-containing protein [Ornithinimicrobium cerasi]SOC57615.1 Peptidoglycan-binding (PGRP) domain of peptidoglycan hydrolases-containing protein [Ornithinimicrobium cerasi]
MYRGKLRRRGVHRQVMAPAALVAVLTGALVLGGGPASADEPASGEGSGDTTAPAQPGGPVAPPPAAPVVPQPLTGLGPDGSGQGAAAFVPVPADPAVVPAPPVNEDLPLEVDEKAPFAQQISCDPVDRPGVTAFALLVSDHYGRPTTFGARPCIDYASFHHDGRALDWPLAAWASEDRMIADAVLSWLTADDAEMAKRLGLEYMIWNGLIYYVDGRGWQFYTGNPHTDHIHFSFSWDGALMRTSWWTGVAVTEPDLGPCDVTPWSYAALHQFPRVAECDTSTLVAIPATGLPRVRPGETGGGVAMLQDVLGVEQTGVLDDATREALVAWQEEHKLPATGIADDLTYAAAQGWELGDLPASAFAVAPEEWQRTEFTALRRTTLTEGAEGDAVSVLQAAIGAEPDGSFGPKTAKALRDWETTVPELAVQVERRGDGPAVVTPLTWVFLERAAYPTLAVRDVELSIGSLDQVADPEGVLVAETLAEGKVDSPYAGGAVALLQELLGVEADGSFGPMTEAAVKAVQEAAELEPTGVVDGPTWVAVEKAALAEDRIQGAPGAEAAKKAAKEKAAEAKAAKEKAEKEKAEQEAKARAEAERVAYEASLAAAG